MKPYGVRMLPLVTRGADYANGQILRDVARLVGVDLGTQTMLPPEELARRIGIILSAEQRFFGQMPETEMHREVPGRPRSFGNLAWHTFNVVDAWLELVVDGKPLDNGAYNRNSPPGSTKADILAYGADVERRFQKWWREDGAAMDWDEAADTYYGEQSLHDFLERTTWHSGQHSRQMMWMMQEALAVAPIDPLGEETYGGLPMPDSVWDAA